LEIIVWRDIVSENKHRLPLNLLKILQLVDLLILVMSFGLTTVLIVHEQRSVPLAAFFSMRTKVSNFLIFLLAIAGCHVVFRVCGLYRSRRLSSRNAEMVDVLKANTIADVYFATVAIALSVRMLTLPFLVVFWCITSAILCISRMTFRIALARIRVHGRNLRYMIIFGTNPRAVAFAKRISACPERGYRLLGFIDDDWPGMKEFRTSGFPIIADCNGLAEYLRRNVVDEAVIYLPFASFYQHWSNVASLCAHHGITVRVNSDTFGLVNAKWLSEDFDGSHYVATYTGAGEGWPLAIKRIIDVVVSAALLIILSPLLLTVAVAIKLTSPGPVLFLQERIGVNKRRFKIRKFRTMIPDAERLLAQIESKNEVSGPVFKIRNDPRITNIGKLLRRSSIDELPQLFNVLQGDMSLVGPRPLPVRDYEGFSEDWQRRRFSVKPGITCLWQVNGRSNVSFDQWMLLDLKYLDEWSLWLDIRILAKTLPVVLKGSGAA
jgi:exopolysaccharide biosynthesis polyprenyl glycosylphosphotransferase